jgi:hypothetical protein
VLVLLLFFGTTGAGLGPASTTITLASANTQGCAGQERGYGNTCHDLLQFSDFHVFTSLLKATGNPIYWKAYQQPARRQGYHTHHGVYRVYHKLLGVVPSKLQKESTCSFAGPPCSTVEDFFEVKPRGLCQRGGQDKRKKQKKGTDLFSGKRGRIYFP